MYHVVVVKEEGVELEDFNSLESAIQNAEGNTEDSEVIRISIFSGFTEIAEWFCSERKNKWYYRVLSGTWKPGHPSLLGGA